MVGRLYDTQETEVRFLYRPLRHQQQFKCSLAGTSDPKSDPLYGVLFLYTFMMTFTKFLEGRKSFNTRDPAYDLGLAADMSDDEKDSTHFINPLLAKVKALGYYCLVARTELYNSEMHPYPDNAANQRNRNYAKGARMRSLRSLVTSNPTHGDMDADVYAFVSRLVNLSRDCEDFVDEGQRYASTKNPTFLESMIESLKQIVRDLDDIIKWNIDLETDYVDDGIVNMVKKIQNTLKRMLTFMRIAEQQIERMWHNSPPNKVTVGFRGRWGS